jgi:perosamine synthetase
MFEALSAFGDGAITYGRRPEVLQDISTTRQLANNEISPYKFGFARTALKFGLRASGFGPGDSLLVPELICESLVEPLAELEVEPQYYPVGPTLEPEWRQLEQILTKSTKALLVAHFFGQPQPIPECLEFCREHSLMLIEDNAHGFGGTYNGQLLGTFGAMGVSAPRKSFPIINGAYLYIADDSDLDLSSLQLQPEASSILKHNLRRWAKKIPSIGKVMKHRRSINEYRKRLGPPPSYGMQEAFRDSPLRKDYGMDKSTESFLRRQDIAHARKVRRQIYYIWQEWASSQGLKPLFPYLAPGAIPLVFPAVSASALDSLQWHERGHRAGVDIHSWPTLPQSIVARNDGAMRLWERMICFPIHQGMNVRSLKNRIAVL